jgi:succinyl-CoA synthetase alpha subunit
MAILVDERTRLLVQGITGHEGRIHTRYMRDYGTEILAGVSPQKGGETVENVPVYNSVRSALREHPTINTSIIFVPADHAVEAVIESIESAIEQIVAISEHIPIHDVLKFIELGNRRSVRIIGPNCPGVISPNKAKVGIMPAQFFSEGSIGIVSRSGTLTYEVARLLTQEGLGQSTIVGIGGDPVVGLDLKEVLQMFKNDLETELIVLIGEIGGDSEERLAEEIPNLKIPIPIVAYIAGVTAPPGKRMGHAGAIISKDRGLASEKKEKLRDARVLVSDLPSEIPLIVKKELKLV